MTKDKLIKSLSCGATVLLACLVCSPLVFAEAEPKEEPAQPQATPKQNDAGPSGVAPLESLGFIHAFVAALSVILVSEIGDKTFFIAAIMAMRHPRITVFVGAISALGLMTVLSAFFGWLVNIIPRIYTFYISTALFVIFGLKMLYEGWAMAPGEGREELEEVQMDLRRRDEQYEQGETADPESGTPRRPKPKTAWAVTSRVFLQSFSLTFLAEWGDRSQLTTIILGAREDVYGVIVGGVLGHAMCTGVAVLGGRMIAQRISVRTVTIIGGIVFLLFALSAFWYDPTAE